MSSRCNVWRNAITSRSSLFGVCRAVSDTYIDSRNATHLKIPLEFVGTLVLKLDTLQMAFTDTLQLSDLHWLVSEDKSLGGREGVWGLMIVGTFRERCQGNERT